MGRCSIEGPAGHAVLASVAVQGRSSAAANQHEGVRCANCPPTEAEVLGTEHSRMEGPAQHIACCFVYDNKLPMKERPVEDRVARAVCKSSCCSAPQHDRALPMGWACTAPISSS